MAGVQCAGLRMIGIARRGQRGADQCEREQSEDAAAGGHRHIMATGARSGDRRRGPGELVTTFEEGVDRCPGRFHVAGILAPHGMHQAPPGADDSEVNV
jgi:hypothetical protein